MNFANISQGWLFVGYIRPVQVDRSAGSGEPKIFINSQSQLDKEYDARPRQGKGRHRAQQRQREPYAWLGAGAITLGVGAALAGGSGVAHADSAGTDSSSPSSGRADAPSANGGEDNSPTSGPLNKAASPASSDGHSKIRSTKMALTGTSASAGATNAASRNSKPLRTPSAASTASLAIVSTKSQGNAGAPGQVVRSNLVAVTNTPLTVSAEPTTISSAGATATPTVARSTSGLASRAAAVAAATAAAMPAHNPVADLLGGALSIAGLNTPAAPANPLGALVWRVFRDVESIAGLLPVAGTITLRSPDPTTGAVSGTLGFAQPDGLPLRYKITSNPANGTVTIDGSGNFTWTPTPIERAAAGATDAAASATQYRFTVTVSDGLASTSRVVVVPVLGSSTPVAPVPPGAVGVTPQATYSDLFTRANGTLGADWTAISNAALYNNQFATTTAWLWASAKWAHPLPTPDQAVSVTLGGDTSGVEFTLRDNGQGTSVQLRFSGDGLNGPPQWQLTTTVGWKSTTQFVSNNVWPSLIGTAGDTFTFSAVGNVYTLTKDGSQVLSWTDTQNTFPAIGQYVSAGLSTGGAVNYGFTAFNASNLSTAVAPTTVPISTQVGTYSWSEIEHLSSQVKAVGFPIIRIGTAGGMDDSTFAACLAAGAQVLLTVYPSGSGDPTSAAVNTLIGQQLSRYGPGGTYWASNPTAPYIPVTSIEILNEPNWYLSGTLAQKAATYAPILVNAYAYTKAHFPTVTVVGGAVSDASGGASTWLPLLFAANPAVAKSFDALSIHPYTGGDAPLAYYAPDQTIQASWGSWQVWTQLDSLRTQLTSYGVPASVPIWITEVGYPITGPDQGGTGLSNTTASATVTPAEEAAYSVRYDIFAMRQGIPRIYHMYIDDDDGFNGGYFVYSTGAARPVATATEQEIALTNGATTMSVLAENYGTGDPFIYSFNTPGYTQVDVAWAQTSQTTAIAIPPGTTTVTDQLGNVITTITTATATTYLAALTETPIWLVTH
jgi:Bacterial Ig domain